MNKEEEEKEEQEKRVQRIWNQICRQRRHPPLTPPRERGNPEKQYLGIGKFKNVAPRRLGEEFTEELRK